MDGHVELTETLQSLNDTAPNSVSLDDLRRQAGTLAAGLSLLAARPGGVSSLRLAQALAFNLVDLLDQARTETDAQRMG